MCEGRNAQGQSLAPTTDGTEFAWQKTRAQTAGLRFPQTEPAGSTAGSRGWSAAEPPDHCQIPVAPRQGRWARGEKLCVEDEDENANDDEQTSARAKPAGVECVSVESAVQMHEAVHAAIADADIFIGAAAVADYRPKRVAEQKIKKTSEAMTLELTRAPDILASVAALKRRPFVVGFAAETEKIEEHARGKRERKRLDMIAANHVGNGRAFDREDNALIVLWRGGRRELENCSKIDLARRLVACIVERQAVRRPARATVAGRRRR